MRVSGEMMQSMFRGDVVLRGPAVDPVIRGQNADCTRPIKLGADQPLGGEHRAIHCSLVSTFGRGDDRGDDHNQITREESSSLVRNRMTS